MAICSICGEMSDSVSGWWPGHLVCRVCEDRLRDRGAEIVQCEAEDDDGECSQVATRRVAGKSLCCECAQQEHISIRVDRKCWHCGRTMLALYDREGRSLGLWLHDPSERNDSRIWCHLMDKVFSCEDFQP